MSQERIEIDQADGVLKRMLVSAGVDLAAADQDEPIQLDCNSIDEPADELRPLGRWTRWSTEDASLEDFFASVEARVETAARYRPVEVTLSQEQV